MFNDETGTQVSTEEYDKLRAEYDALNRTNEALVSERASIDNDVEALRVANTALKHEVDQFETTIHELKEQRIMEYQHRQDELTNGSLKRKSILLRQLSFEEQVSGAVTPEEKDNMISDLDEKVMKLAEECEQYKDMLRILELERSSHEKDNRYMPDNNNISCEECLRFQECIRGIESEMNYQLEARGLKYDKMVDYYDNVLRERAHDIEEIKINLSDLTEENSNLKKILKNTVGSSQRATTEQVTNFRRASRVSAIQGTALIPRDIDKDQLITQLTNELTRANEQNTTIEDNLNELDARHKSQLEYLENQRDHLEEDLRNQFMSEIRNNLEDREFLRQLFFKKKEEDPTFFKQIMTEAGAGHTMEMEGDEDLEFRLKQKSDEARVLEGELREADDYRQNLEHQLKKEKSINKNLCQYKYAKDSVDHLVSEYCSGIVFTKKPEAFQFEDDNLNTLANTLYVDQARVKSISEDNRKLREEMAKHNDDQKSLKIETLEKQIATQKDTIHEHFKDTIKYKGRIQDLEDELRQTKYELSDKYEMLEKLEEDRREYREKLDITDMRIADQEDELQQRKRELDEEMRQQKGAKLKNLQLHSQIWIQKNRYKKLEKHRDELASNCEMLTEEVQLLKEKLEAANCQMEEQQKTSRRISSILKPGSAGAGGKDAIIRDLKDALARQKTYSASLEEHLKKYQEKTRDLESSLRETSEERDNARADFEASFSRLDSEDPGFGGGSQQVHTPFPMEMMLDPLHRISVDYTAQDEEVHEEYNKLFDEFQQERLHNDELQKKNRKLSMELDREQTYSETIEENYERLLIKNKELQDVLSKRQNRPGYFENSLPAIQETVEESLYSGELSPHQIEELLAKIEKLQEDLEREKIWVEHLEEQNDKFRLDLSGNKGGFSDEERTELMRKCSESREMLDERLFQLEEAQKTINELKGLVQCYQESECKYHDNIEEFEKQLETSLIDSSENELKINALQIENEVFQDQITDLMEEQTTLRDKNIVLQESLTSISEEKDVATKTVEDQTSAIESLTEEVKQCKKISEESTQKLDEYSAQFGVLKEELATSKEEVEQLLLQRSETEKVIQEKESELAIIMEKMAEADTDTTDLKEKLATLTRLEETTSSKDELITQLDEKLAKLSEKCDELDDSLKKEVLMNQKNRHTMTGMQHEVRDARKERQKAISVQVTSEGRIKNVEMQCEEKMKLERVMNDKNRELMNKMQTEVRRARADRAILQTELIDSKKMTKTHEDQGDADKMEIEKLKAKIEILEESNEVADIKSAMSSLSEAMQLMESRDADLMESIEQKMKDNTLIQEEIAKLQSNIEESNFIHKTILEAKNATITSLEIALGEEIQRGDEIERVYKSFKDRELKDFTTQSCPAIAEQGCQVSVDCQNQTVQYDLQTVEYENQFIQAVVEQTNAETSVEKQYNEFSVQTVVDIDNRDVQTELTVEEICKNESEVESLTAQVHKLNISSSKSYEELSSIKDVLVEELKQVKDTVSSLELQASEKETKIQSLEENLEEQSAYEYDLVEQLRTAQERNEEITLEFLEIKTHTTVLENENRNLHQEKYALQTELNVQIDARNEIDSVIGDNEKSFIAMSDLFNAKEMEQDEAKEMITILKEDKEHLEQNLEDTQKKLEAEMKFCDNIQSTFIDFQEETGQLISSLNSELRRKLLEQSYAHIISSDSEDDDVSTLPRPIKRADNTDLNNALNETKTSVKALIKANSKLCRQLDKLSSEKDSFLLRSDEFHQETEEMAKQMFGLAADKENLESIRKSLELEIMEKEVSLECSEEALVVLKRQFENMKLISIKKAPRDQETLTELHNLFHRCFMLMPSDPARELLHMFVSQYKENLCSNCYARITTLGSNPCTPRKSRESGKSTIYSDIMLQTDGTIFKSGTDSAYSSSVSIQTDRFSSEQNVERLKVKNCQLINDLTDSKKSEKELEQALQYQLKETGELRKRISRSQKREKELQEKISEFKVNEDELHAMLKERDKKYAELLKCYQGLSGELNTQRDLSDRLQLDIEDLRMMKSLPVPPRSSTPDLHDKTPPSNECSLYLSPITAHSRDSKLYCDREIDTMSPLIITWADSATQTELFEFAEETVQDQLVAHLQQLTGKLCQRQLVEDDTLPSLTTAVETKLKQLQLEKRKEERKSKAEMLDVQEQLKFAREQLSQTEESNLDLEDELKRVLDLQEEERLEMQNKVRALATQFKAELNKARHDKKFAEETLNTSLEKICEESNMITVQQEQLLESLREERNEIQGRLDEVKDTTRDEREALQSERDELERNFAEFRAKSVSDKEDLIESQKMNLDMLEKMKSEYESKGSEIAGIQTECESALQNLKKENEEAKIREKENYFEIEQLKNKLQELSNKEGDAEEKLAQSQKIVEIMKQDVLETRGRLEDLAGCELQQVEAEVLLKSSLDDNEELQRTVEFLEGDKLMLIEEAKELKEDIENARKSLDNAQRVNTESYKNPVIAAVAHLWVQEREEHTKLRNEIESLNAELEDVKIENVGLEESMREMSELKEKLNTSDNERCQLKTKLGTLQECKIEAENQIEAVKEDLNKSHTQLEVSSADRIELQNLLDKHQAEKDRLLDDLNQSFKEKAEKATELEDCLVQLAQTQDELFTVKDELVRNRLEETKLRDSLARARDELDYLESNVSKMKGERDVLLGTQPKLRDLEDYIKVQDSKNLALSKQVDLLRGEKRRIEEDAAQHREKLEKDIIDVLEAFEEYKTKTSAAPEKLQELKYGMAALQETLHQIMNSNSELNRINAKLNQTVEKMKGERDILMQERNDYKHQLDNSIIDFSKDDSNTQDILAQNLALEEDIKVLTVKTERNEKLEHDNTILKNKVRKMKEMLREKEDELISFNESNELRDDYEQENSLIKKQLSSTKHKLDKAKEANIMLKDRIRETESEMSSRFLASTPNQSRILKEHDITDELDALRSELESLKRSRGTGSSNLAADSRVSFAPSHVSTMENMSLSERCKTLEIELSDMKDRYKMLHETHEEEQAKSIDMSDALRSSVRILKGYIDRSCDTKGARMNELQNQLDEQRTHLIEQFGLDVSQAFSPDQDLAQFQVEQEIESLASGSTVCLEPEDSQVI